MTTPIPVYLDCDTGVDDTVALAYLLASPAVEVVGIGTVSGNIDAAQAARNTLDLLALAGHADIPVAVGAHDHLDHPYGGGARHVHGENGIGGVELPRAAAEPDPRGAAQLLVDLSHTYEGRLHVLTIGPMTNLAHALELDPTLPGRVAEVTAMGGAALAAGNITPVAEANVYNDPQAAAALVGADWNVTLVPLDVTLDHTLDEDQRRMLLASPHPFVRAVGEILDHYFDFYLPTYGVRSCALHDPLAAVIAAGGSQPTRAPRVPVEVDVSHGPGRGQTIADLRGQRLGVRHHDGARTRVVLEVDAPIGPHLVETILSV
ncbi:nucleoside hydrolase [Microbacterium sp. cx-55]|uniref:nucleoside hydrolase n=1 Tax=Microbacterium sp. cx-55 TaxID=2875948 RepID=UPI001CBBED80|nr:nucleoside hydrolase [Microbacterium sp. cx-55]MBZ4488455.1 nucleoside hydrolase [Microbacterium sp. cx-55]UGB35101.1 nucleoside hydrolase [Microbacterium sp. cx-55]